MGNLLAVVVYAANIYDTKSCIMAARETFARYPFIQRFCADAGYRKTFELDVSQKLGFGVDTSARIKPEWGICLNAGLLNILWPGSTIPPPPPTKRWCIFFQFSYASSKSC